MDLTLDANDFSPASVKMKMMAWAQATVDKENASAAATYGRSATSYSAAAKWALDNGQTPPARPMPPFAIKLDIIKDGNGNLLSFDVIQSDQYVAPPVDEVKPAEPKPAFHIDLGVHIYGSYWVCGKEDTCPADFVTPPMPDGHSYRKITYPFGAWYLQVS